MTTPATRRSANHGQLDGPWDCALWCELPPAASKSNARRFSAGDAASRKAWAAHSTFVQHAKLLLRSARPATWDLGTRDAPVGERPTVVVLLVARTLLDAGNLSKSILDAAEGMLYHRDSQVSTVTSHVEARSRNDQRTYALFAQLPAGADGTASVLAQQALLDRWQNRDEWLPADQKA